MSTGEVILAGAGCGDPGYLTLKAREALEQAEVVVFDALANPVLLDYAPDAEKIYVGKRAGCHEMSQQGICELLVRLGQEGRKVVRLKGGDPYVFGRGGEEGEALYDAGVPFEVIPGITAPIGGLESSGIPITHRDCNQAFAVITGHLKEGSDELDWENLAHFRGTMVFMMGIRNLEKIMDSLMEHGMDPDMPAAVVLSASMPEARTIIGTVKDLAKKAREQGAKAPGMIVIGRVVEKHDKLDFHANRDRFPLAGKRLVITRARGQEEPFQKTLRHLGAEVIHYPVIRTETIDEGVNRLAEALKERKATQLILTSPNGVSRLAEAMDRAELDARALHGMTVSVMGPGTGRELEKLGIRADRMPQSAVAESLLETLKPTLTENDRVLLPRAEGARPLLVEELSKICPVEEISTYRTLTDQGDRDMLIQDLESGKIDGITFTSGSTVRHMIDSLGEQAGLLSDVALFSIGPQTSEMLEKHGYQPAAEAEAFTIDGLTETISQYFNPTDNDSAETGPEDTDVTDKA